MKQKAFHPGYLYVRDNIRRVINALLFITYLFTSITYAYCHIQDDTNQQITLNKPATRIIVLAPDLTEILFTIGAGKQIVGVLKEADYPAEVKSIPTVAAYSSIDKEKITQAKPDLVIVWGSHHLHSLTWLKQQGIPIYISESHKLSDIARTMQRLGCLTGHTQQANKAAQEFIQALNQLKKTYHQAQPTRVFFQVNAEPLMTINGSSWINEVIELCGGCNIFKSEKLIAPVISREAVIVANPEVIFTDSAQSHWQESWQKWPNLAAMQQKRLFVIPSDLIDRAGPRLILGAKLMCERLHESNQSREQ